MIPPLLLKHKVHMRRPPRMPAQLPEQLAHRPVVRDSITDGLEALEPKPPVLVAHHDAPLARALAPLVLHVVVPRAVRLPNVHLDAGHRSPPRVLNCAHGQHRLPRRVRRHGAAVRQHRRVVRVERPEHGALGAERRLGVVDVVDEEREAEDVGEEDEFLRCRDGRLGTAEMGSGGGRGRGPYIAHIVRDVPARNEEADAGHPLVGAKACLARKVVEVCHQARHEVGEARIGRLRVDADGIGRDVVDCKVEERRRIGRGRGLLRCHGAFSFLSVEGMGCCCRRGMPPVG